MLQEGCCSGTPKAMKSFADVGRQVEAELTLIIPSISMTSCERAWACVKYREVKRYGEDIKSLQGSGSPSQ